MSVKVMTEVWELDLGHAQQIVLLALADVANDDGGDVYPSLLYVAWKTGYHERQIRRIVRELEKAGVLVKVTDASRHKAIEYRIDTSAASKKPPWREYRESFKAAEKPAEGGGTSCPPTPRADISAAQGGHFGPPGGTSEAVRADIAVSAEPVKDPTKEDPNPGSVKNPPRPQQAGGAKPSPPPGGRRRDHARYRVELQAWCDANVPHPSPEQAAQMEEWWAPRAARLREIVGETSYELWLSGLHPHAVHGGVLYLGVPEEHIAWVTTRAPRALRVVLDGRTWEAIPCNESLTKESNAHSHIDEAE